MTVTVRQLAEWVRGRVDGDPDLPVHAARTLREARSGDITFLEDEKHLPQLHASQASAAVVGPNVPADGKTLLRVADPLAAFIAIVQKLSAVPPEEHAPGIDPSARIHPAAQVSPDACVGPFVSVGEGTVVGPRCRLHAGAVVGRYCRLGEDVALHPHVVLYDGTVLGDRVIIHANAVIGADGFGYRTQQGRHVKVPQLGHVEIGDDVEVGACTTIDRGTFGATRVGPGTKIDNLVMIGHNCQIGRHNLLVSQVGIAGSCTTGDYVVMAGQVGVADHVNIGDRALLGAKCGVHKDVLAGQRMLGMPATPDKEQMRMMMTLERLPAMRKDIRRIKEQLGLDAEE